MGPTYPLVNVYLPLVEGLRLGERLWQGLDLDWEKTLPGLESVGLQDLIWERDCGDRIETVLQWCLDVNGKKQVSYRMASLKGIGHEIFLFQNIFPINAFIKVASLFLPWPRSLLFLLFLALQA